MKNYIKTFESFREDMKNVDSLNESKSINEAEDVDSKEAALKVASKKTKKSQPVKKSYSPFHFIMALAPFSEFKQFKDFLLSLSMDDFKKLYGDKSPQQLLIDLLTNSGIKVNVEPKIKDGYTVYYPAKIDDKLVAWSDKEIEFAPIIDNDDENLAKWKGVSEIKNVPIAYLKPRWSFDSQSNYYRNEDIWYLSDGSLSGRMVDSAVKRVDTIPLEKYLEDGFIFKFGKEDRSKEVFAKILDVYGKSNIDLAKVKLPGGETPGSFDSFVEFLNGLSDKAVNSLVDSGIITKEGENVTYSEEAKKLANERLGNQIADSSPNSDEAKV